MMQHIAEEAEAKTKRSTVTRQCIEAADQRAARAVAGSSHTSAALARMVSAIPMAYRIHYLVVPIPTPTTYLV